MFVFSQPLLDSIAVTFVSNLFVTLLYLLVRARAEKNYFTPLSHIRQISYLVVPTVFIFCFLVINSSVAHLISILVVILLFFLGGVVGVEALLRRFVANADRPDPSFRPINHKWGLHLPFEEAKFATGGYPREYMTEEFYNSARYRYWKEWSVNEFRTSDPTIHFDENNIIDVDNFSIKNGLRTTTDTPEKYDFNILLFGGSTTLMEEVPDDLTYASFLQRRFNFDKKVRVINHGARGATVLNRASFLIKRTPINKGDIVIFYFGVNDSGQSVHGRPSSSLRSPLLILFGKSGVQNSEIGKWVRGELLFRHNSRCSTSAFNSTVSAIGEAKKFVEGRGAKMMAVLQPNLFVSNTKTAYEKSLRSRWSSFIIGQIKFCYPKYEAFVDQCDFGVSLSNIFDNLDSLVYLDWCHVNARGAEIVANSLHRELVNLGYV